MKIFLRTSSALLFLGIVTMLLWCWFGAVNSTNSCSSSFRKISNEFNFSTNRAGVWGSDIFSFKEMYCRPNVEKCTLESANWLTVFYDDTSYFLNFADSIFAPPANVFCKIRMLDD